MDSAADLKGWVWRFSVVGKHDWKEKSWRRRYAAVSKKQICFYKGTDTAAAPAGLVRLSSSSKCVAYTTQQTDFAYSPDGYNYFLGIRFDEPENEGVPLLLLLKCETQEGHQQWVEYFNQFMEKQPFNSIRPDFPTFNTLALETFPTVSQETEPESSDDDEEKELIARLMSETRTPDAPSVVVEAPKEGTTSAQAHIDAAKKRLMRERKAASTAATSSPAVTPTGSAREGLKERLAALKARQAAKESSARTASEPDAASQSGVATQRRRQGSSQPAPEAGEDKPSAESSPPVGASTSRSRLDGLLAKQRARSGDDIAKKLQGFAARLDREVDAEDASQAGESHEEMVQRAPSAVGGASVSSGQGGSAAPVTASEKRAQLIAKAKEARARKMVDAMLQTDEQPPEDVEAKLKDATERLEAAAADKTELATLRERVATFEKEAADTTELGALRERVATLEETLQAAEARLAEKSGELGQTKDMLDASSTSIAELQKEVQAKDALGGELEELKKQCEALKKEAGDREYLELELEKRAKQVEELQKSADEGRAASEKLAEATEANQRIMRDLGDLQVQAADLAQVRSEHEEKIHALESQLRESTQEQLNLDASQATIVSLETERGELKAALDTRETDLEKHAAKITELSAGEEAMQRTLRQQAAELARLQETMQAAGIELPPPDAAAEPGDAPTGTLPEQLAAAARENEVLRREKAKAAASLAEKEEQIASLEQEKGDLLAKQEEGSGNGPPPQDFYLANVGPSADEQELRTLRERVEDLETQLQSSAAGLSPAAAVAAATVKAAEEVLKESRLPAESGAGIRSGVAELQALAAPGGGSVQEVAEKAAALQKELADAWRLLQQDAGAEEGDFAAERAVNDALLEARLCAEAAKAVPADPSDDTAGDDAATAADNWKKVAQRLMREKEALAADLQALSGDTERLREENERVKTALEDVGLDPDGADDELHHKINSLVRELDEQKAEAARLREIEEEANNSKHALDSLETQLALANPKLAELQSIIDVKTEQCASLAAELQEQENNFAARHLKLEEELSEAQTQVRELEEKAEAAAPAGEPEVYPVDSWTTTSPREMEVSERISAVERERDAVEERLAAALRERDEALDKLKNTGSMGEQNELKEMYGERPTAELLEEAKQALAAAESENVQLKERVDVAEGERDAALRKAEDAREAQAEPEAREQSLPPEELARLADEAAAHKIQALESNLVNLNDSICELEEALNRERRKGNDAASNLEQAQKEAQEERDRLLRSLSAETSTLYRAETLQGMLKAHLAALDESPDESPLSSEQLAHYSEISNMPLHASDPTDLHAQVTSLQTAAEELGLDDSASDAWKEVARRLLHEKRELQTALEQVQQTPDMPGRVLEKVDRGLQSVEEDILTTAKVRQLSLVVAALRDNEVVSKHLTPEQRGEVNDALNQFVATQRGALASKNERLHGVVDELCSSAGGVHALPPDLRERVEAAQEKRLAGEVTHASLLELQRLAEDLRATEAIAEGLPDGRAGRIDQALHDQRVADARNLDDQHEVLQKALDVVKANCPEHELPKELRVRLSNQDTWRSIAERLQLEKKELRDALQAVQGSEEAVSALPPELKEKLGVLTREPEEVSPMDALLAENDALRRQLEHLRSDARTADELTLPATAAGEEVDTLRQRIQELESRQHRPAEAPLREAIASMAGDEEFREKLTDDQKRELDALVAQPAGDHDTAAMRAFVDAVGQQHPDDALPPAARAAVESAKAADADEQARLQKDLAAVDTLTDSEKAVLAAALDGGATPENLDSLRSLAAELVLTGKLPEDLSDEYTDALGWKEVARKLLHEKKALEDRLAADPAEALRESLRASAENGVLDNPDVPPAAAESLRALLQTPLSDDPAVREQQLADMQALATNLAPFDPTVAAAASQSAAHRPEELASLRAKHAAVEVELANLKEMQALHDLADLSDPETRGKLEQLKAETSPEDLATLREMKEIRDLKALEQAGAFDAARDLKGTGEEARLRNLRELQDLHDFASSPEAGAVKELMDDQRQVDELKRMKEVKELKELRDAGEDIGQLSPDELNTLRELREIKELLELDNGSDAVVELRGLREDLAGVKEYGLDELKELRDLKKSGEIDGLKRLAGAPEAELEELRQLHQIQDLLHVKQSGDIDALRALRDDTEEVAELRELKEMQELMDFKNSSDMQQLRSLKADGAGGTLQELRDIKELLNARGKLGAEDFRSLRSELSTLRDARPVRTPSFSSPEEAEHAHLVLASVLSGEKDTSNLPPDLVERMRIVAEKGVELSSPEELRALSSELAGRGVDLGLRSKGAEDGDWQEVAGRLQTEKAAAERDLAAAQRLVLEAEYLDQPTVQEIVRALRQARAEEIFASLLPDGLRTRLDTALLTSLETLNPDATSPEHQATHKTLQGLAHELRDNAAFSQLTAPSKVAIDSCLRGWREVTLRLLKEKAELERLLATEDEKAAEKLQDALRTAVSVLGDRLPAEERDRLLRLAGEPLSGNATRLASQLEALRAAANELGSSSHRGALPEDLLESLTATETWKEVSRRLLRQKAFLQEEIRRLHADAGDDAPQRRQASTVPANENARVASAAGALQNLAGTLPPDVARHLEDLGITTGAGTPTAAEVVEGINEVMRSGQDLSRSQRASLIAHRDGLTQQILAESSLGRALSSFLAPDESEAAAELSAEGRRAAAQLQAALAAGTRPSDDDLRMLGSELVRTGLLSSDVGAALCDAAPTVALKAVLSETMNCAAGLTDAQRLQIGSILDAEDDLAVDEILAALQTVTGCDDLPPGLRRELEAQAGRWKDAAEKLRADGQPKPGDVHAALQRLAAVPGLPEEARRVMRTLCGGTPLFFAPADSPLATDPSELKERVQHLQRAMGEVSKHCTTLPSNLKERMRELALETGSLGELKKRVSDLLDVLREVSDSGASEGLPYALKKRLDSTVALDVARDEKDLRKQHDELQSVLQKVVTSDAVTDLPVEVQAKLRKLLESAPRTDVELREDVLAMQEAIRSATEDPAVCEALPPALLESLQDVATAEIAVGPALNEQHSLLYNKVCDLLSSDAAESLPTDLFNRLSELAEGCATEDDGADPAVLQQQIDDLLETLVSVQESASGAQLPEGLQQMLRDMRAMGRSSRKPPGKRTFPLLPLLESIAQSAPEAIANLSLEQQDKFNAMLRCPDSELSAIEVGAMLKCLNLDSAQLSDAIRTQIAQVVVEEGESLVPQVLSDLTSPTFLASLSTKDQMALHSLLSQNRTDLATVAQFAATLDPSSLPPAARKRLQSLIRSAGHLEAANAGSRGPSVSPSAGDVGKGSVWEKSASAVLDAVASSPALLGALSASDRKFLEDHRKLGKAGIDRDSVRRAMHSSPDRALSTLDSMLLADFKQTVQDLIHEPAMHSLPEALFKRLAGLVGAEQLPPPMPTAAALASEAHVLRQVLGPIAATNPAVASLLQSMPPASDAPAMAAHVRDLQKAVLTVANQPGLAIPPSVVESCEQAIASDIQNMKRAAQDMSNRDPGLQPSHLHHETMQEGIHAADSAANLVEQHRMLEGLLGKEAAAVATGRGGSSVVEASAQKMKALETELEGLRKELDGARTICGVERLLPIVSSPKWVENVPNEAHRTEIELLLQSPHLEDNRKAVVLSHLRQAGWEARVPDASVAAAIRQSLLAGDSDEAVRLAAPFFVDKPQDVDVSDRATTAVRTRKGSIMSEKSMKADRLQQALASLVADPQAESSIADVRQAIDRLISSDCADPYVQNELARMSETLLSRNLPLPAAISNALAGVEDLPPAWKSVHHQHRSASQLARFAEIDTLQQAFTALLCDPASSHLTASEISLLTHLSQADPEAVDLAKMKSTAATLLSHPACSRLPEAVRRALQHGRSDGLWKLVAAPVVREKEKARGGAQRLDEKGGKEEAAVLRRGLTSWLADASLSEGHPDRQAILELIRDETNGTPELRAAVAKLQMESEANGKGEIPIPGLASAMQRDESWREACEGMSKQLTRERSNSEKEAEKGVIALRGMLASVLPSLAANLDPQAKGALVRLLDETDPANANSNPRAALRELAVAAQTIQLTHGDRLPSLEGTALAAMDHVPPETWRDVAQNMLAQKSLVEAEITTLKSMHPTGGEPHGQQASDSGISDLSALLGEKQELEMKLSELRASLDDGTTGQWYDLAMRLRDEKNALEEQLAKLSITEDTLSHCSKLRSTLSAIATSPAARLLPDGYRAHIERLAREGNDIGTLVEAVASIKAQHPDILQSLPPEVQASLRASAPASPPVLCKAKANELEGSIHQLLAAIGDLEGELDKDVKQNSIVELQGLLTEVSRHPSIPPQLRAHLSMLTAMQLSSDGPTAAAQLSELRKAAVNLSTNPHLAPALRERLHVLGIETGGELQTQIVGLKKALSAAAEAATGATTATTTTTMTTDTSGTSPTGDSRTSSAQGDAFRGAIEVMLESGVSLPEPLRQWLRQLLRGQFDSPPPGLFADAKEAELLAAADRDSIADLEHLLRTTAASSPVTVIHSGATPLEKASALRDTLTRIVLDPSREIPADLRAEAKHLITQDLSAMDSDELDETLEQLKTVSKAVAENQIGGPVAPPHLGSPPTTERRAEELRRKLSLYESAVTGVLNSAAAKHLSPALHHQLAVLRRGDAVRSRRGSLGAASERSLATSGFGRDLPPRAPSAANDDGETATVLKMRIAELEMKAAQLEGQSDRSNAMVRQLKELATLDGIPDDVKKAIQVTIASDEAAVLAAEIKAKERAAELEQMARDHPPRTVVDLETQVDELTSALAAVVKSEAGGQLPVEMKERIAGLLDGSKRGAKDGKQTVTERFQDLQDTLAAVQAEPGASNLPDWLHRRIDRLVQSTADSSEDVLLETLRKLEQKVAKLESSSARVDTVLHSVRSLSVGADLPANAARAVHNILAADVAAAQRLLAETEMSNATSMTASPGEAGAAALSAFLRIIETKIGTPEGSAVQIAEASTAASGLCNASGVVGSSMKAVASLTHDALAKMKMPLCFGEVIDLTAQARDTCEAAANTAAAARSTSAALAAMSHQGLHSDVTVFANRLEREAAALPPQCSGEVNSLVSSLRSLSMTSGVDRVALLNRLAADAARIAGFSSASPNSRAPTQIGSYAGDYQQGQGPALSLGYDDLSATSHAIAVLRSKIGQLSAASAPAGAIAALDRVLQLLEADDLMAVWDLSVNPTRNGPPAPPDAFLRSPPQPPHRSASISTDSFDPIMAKALRELLRPEAGLPDDSRADIADAVSMDGSKVGRVADAALRSFLEKRDDLDATARNRLETLLAAADERASALSSGIASVLRSNLVSGQAEGSLRDSFVDADQQLRRLADTANAAMADPASATAMPAHVYRQLNDALHVVSEPTMEAAATLALRDAGLPEQTKRVIKASLRSAAGVDVAIEAALSCPTVGHATRRVLQEALTSHRTPLPRMTGVSPLLPSSHVSVPQAVRAACVSALPPCSTLMAGALEAGRDRVSVMENAIESVLVSGSISQAARDHLTRLLSPPAGVGAEGDAADEKGHGSIRDGIAAVLAATGPEDMNAALRHRLQDLSGGAPQARSAVPTDRLNKRTQVVVLEPPGAGEWLDCTIESQLPDRRYRVRVNNLPSNHPAVRFSGKHLAVAEAHIRFSAAAQPKPDINTTVQRNPSHWKWGDQDGGPGKLGTVIDRSEGEWITVQWTQSGRRSRYRWGKDGCYDVMVVKPKDTIHVSGRVASTGQRRELGTVVLIDEHNFATVKWDGGTHGRVAINGGEIVPVPQSQRTGDEDGARAALRAAIDSVDGDSLSDRARGRLEALLGSVSPHRKVTEDLRGILQGIDSRQRRASSTFSNRSVQLPTTITDPRSPSFDSPWTWWAAEVQAVLKEIASGIVEAKGHQWVLLTAELSQRIRSLIGKYGTLPPLPSAPSSGALQGLFAGADASNSQILSALRDLMDTRDFRLAEEIRSMVKGKANTKSKGTMTGTDFQDDTEVRALVKKLDLERDKVRNLQSELMGMQQGREQVSRPREDESGKNDRPLRDSAKVEETDPEVAKALKELQLLGKPSPPRDVDADWVDRVVEDAWQDPNLNELLPENFGRDDSGGVRFGTRKVDLVAINEFAAVRIGGGYMLFSDFVKRFADTERRKLIINKGAAGPEPSVLMRSGRDMVFVDAPDDPQKPANLSPVRKRPVATLQTVDRAPTWNGLQDRKTSKRPLVTTPLPERSLSRPPTPSRTSSISPPGQRRHGGVERTDFGLQRASYSLSPPKRRVSVPPGNARYPYLGDVPYGETTAHWAGKAAPPPAQERYAEDHVLEEEDEEAGGTGLGSLEVLQSRLQNILNSAPALPSPGPPTHASRPAYLPDPSPVYASDAARATSPPPGPSNYHSFDSRPSPRGNTRITDADGRRMYPLASHPVYEDARVGATDFETYMRTQPRGYR